MNKKGGILDLVLHPVFVTVVVLGLVFFSVMHAITNIGESKEFDKKRLAADISLLIESFQSVPRELNLFINYDFPSDFNLDIKVNKVKVSNGDSQIFFFERNPDFDVFSRSFKKSDFNNSKLVVFRSGNKLDFAISKNFKLEQDIFCPSSESLLTKIEVFPSTITEWLVKNRPNIFSETSLPSGQADLVVGFMGIPKGVRVYTLDETSLIGCYIIASVVKEFPEISANVVPVNPKFLHGLDDRKIILKEKNSLVIGFSQDIDKKRLAYAIYKGLNNYGLS
ncbi:hypothetical protein DRJ22_04720 [Candidatus Woesearchaeota archaeon]|nr:MAG: hypothetical protein DRJ22_04720 [Candidatus Woesearchaeota archaeon]